jgi:hypothetical protein
MEGFWWGFVVGLFIGVSVGVFALALFVNNQPYWGENETQSHHQV